MTLVAGFTAPGSLTVEGVEPPCTEFVADVGGAHRWCVTCGWQTQHHPAPDRGSPASDGGSE